MKPAQRSLIRLFSLIEGSVECVLVGVVVGKVRVLGAALQCDKKKVFLFVREGERSQEVKASRNGPESCSRTFAGTILDGAALTTA